MVSGTTSENCTHGTHLKFIHHQHNDDSAFVKCITSDNKLMNLCEMWLFHRVWGVSKGTRHNYHKIWWKYCFGTKIVLGFGEFRRGTRGMYVHDPQYIFCLLLKKNRKSTRAWPILKSNSTSFLFKKCFLGWIIKNLWKGGPRGPRSYFFMKWV